MTIALVQGDLNPKITLGNRDSIRAVSVYPHGPQVNKVDVSATFYDSTKKVVRGVYVVVDGVALVPGGLHGVRGGTLLREVDQGIRSKIVKQFHDPIVVVCYIEALKVDGFTKDFLPNLEAFGDRRYRGQRRYLKLDIDFAPNEALTCGRRDFVITDDVEVVEGDIRDREAATAAIEGVNAVVHLAAYGSVVESVADPEPNFDVNARGTFVMLDASRRAGVDRFVFASTGGALIGEADPPVNERSLPKPISPYGASKLCGEAYCHAFARSYGLRTVALRFANIYGPISAHKRGAVTAFMKAIMTREPMRIFGDGTASRDFLYVDDLCAAILRSLSTDLAPGIALHVASEVETRIIDLARAIADVAGAPGHPIEHAPTRTGEVTRNFATADLARAILNFTPPSTSVTA